MKKLGKKIRKSTQSIEAYGCSGKKVCDCSQYDKTYGDVNDDVFWFVFWGK